LLRLGLELLVPRYVARTCHRPTLGGVQRTAATPPEPTRTRIIRENCHPSRGSKRLICILTKPPLGESITCALAMNKPVRPGDSGSAPWPSPWELADVDWLVSPDSIREIACRGKELTAVPAFGNDA
jgi:hypothetical protein